jgi:exodeoxyribonuclease VII large subunit
MVAEFPTPMWVRGEVSGYRRTSGGAVFFKLADPDVEGAVLDVAGRGMIMADVERTLEATGLGGLRDGVEIRVRGTVGVTARNSQIRLSLLEIDPTFIAGRLALERAQVLARLSADGTLMANGAIPVPLVPLRIGLVTSRGSAAHGDFADQLRRSGYRFSVRTAHTTVQGETAPGRVAESLSRFGHETVDMLAIVRGGGSKLDLAVFDTEVVARAIAAAPVPVLTGIGHEMDRTIADEAAAVAEKTPSAAGEWLVSRVAEFAGRLDRARAHIGREGREALRRHRHQLRVAMADVSGAALTLRRQEDHLHRLGADLARGSRRVVERHQVGLETLRQWFSAIDLEPTLRRGFAIVTAVDRGTVIKTVGQVSPGDLLSIRFADGTVVVEVSDE